MDESSGSGTPARLLADAGDTRLRDWARELGVSEYVLRRAIDRVGPSAAAVRTYLRRR